MGPNHYHKGRTPSFGRSVGLYGVFMLALAVVALLSTMTGGPMTQAASVAQAGIEFRNNARIETPRGDPSLPSAAEALVESAPAAPAEAMAPTF